MASQSRLLLVGIGSTTYFLLRRHRCHTAGYLHKSALRGQSVLYCSVSFEMKDEQLLDSLAFSIATGLPSITFIMHWGGQAIDDSNNVIPTLCDALSVSAKSAAAGRASYMAQAQAHRLLVRQAPKLGNQRAHKT